MGYARNVGKYELSWIVGEGAFAKVKLAKNITNGQNVAIKIIDKHMVVANNLMYQVQREIRAMRLLNHPNIVRIHEVIGTKTKIYIVMEYVPGGQLSDKLSYAQPLSEKEARKYFQQLIDAVEYCHSRGVYHRDLKPENLLLDYKGDLKLSDFGLSTSRKPGSLLLTTCGSPSYVAPELLNSKGYEGAGADIWSCGVILFEMLAGYLPFDDINLLSLYRKIWRAEYECPKWLTLSQKKLIGRILNPVATKRITIAEIMEDEWFQIDYKQRYEGMDNAKHIQEDLEFVEESSVNKIIPQTPRFINAFQLIVMLHELELSGMFEEQEDEKNRIILGSNYTTTETIQRIEAAAKKARLSAERINNSKIKMQLKLKSKSRSSLFDLLAEVTEVAPTVCLVEISKSSVGKLNMYQEFCESLSSLLTKEETSKPLTEWSV